MSSQCRGSPENTHLANIGLGLVGIFSGRSNAVLSCGLCYQQPKRDNPPRELRLHTPGCYIYPYPTSFPSTMHVLTGSCRVARCIYTRTRALELINNCFECTTSPAHLGTASVPLLQSYRVTAEFDICVVRADIEEVV